MSVLQERDGRAKEKNAVSAHRTGCDACGSLADLEVEVLHLIKLAR